MAAAHQMTTPPPPTHTQTHTHTCAPSKNKISSWHPWWRGYSYHPPLLFSVDIQTFLCCWAHQWVLFFLRMYQTTDLATPNVPDISLIYLFSFFLVLNPNNCLFHLYGEIVWPHDVGSQQQLPNANHTLRIISRTFTCLIDGEIMKE